MKNNNGFTFIELILYIALVAMMMSYLTPFAWSMIQGNAKVVTQQELYTQARYVSERIKMEVRNADDMNTVSSTSISLAVSDSSKNPTIIDLSSGKMRIKWGTADPIDLHSDHTRISQLVFTDYSSADDTSKHIGFSFDMETNYASTRQEYVDSISIQSSAEVRSN